MDRADFVDKLNRASAALADTDMLPVLTHFWFTGNELMAYNDRIGISIPMPTDFKGAVPGKLLLDVLKASSGKDVKMTIEKDCLIVSTKGTRLQLGYRPPSAFIKTFTMPKPDETARLRVAKREFVEALGTCMRSVSSDTTVTDQLGVTLLPNGKELEFYATDSATFSFDWLQLKSEASFDRVILPGMFCQQVLDFTKNSKSMWLEVHDKYALFKGDNGELLWGNLIVSQAPLDFPGIRRRNFPEKLVKNLIAIPKGLEAALDRACIIAATEIRTPKTAVSVKDGSMYLITKANGNEVKDEVKLEANHSNVSLHLNPRFFRAGMDLFREGKFVVTTGAAILVKGNSEFYIAAGE